MIAAAAVSWRFCSGGVGGDCGSEIFLENFTLLREAGVRAGALDLDLAEEEGVAKASKRRLGAGVKVVVDLMGLAGGICCGVKRCLSGMDFGIGFASGEEDREEC